MKKKLPTYLPCFWSLAETNIILALCLKNGFLITFFILLLSDYNSSIHYNMGNLFLTCLKIMAYLDMFSAIK